MPVGGFAGWLTKLDGWVDTMTDMRTAMRTHTCGQLRASDGDAEVALCGWVAHRRDHGGVTFIDLRDRDGVVQLVFHPADAPEAHGAAQSLGAEDVVRVTGVVRLRPAGMVNPGLDTGEIEVAATGLEILSESDTPPFPIEDRTEANEDLRLKYRYLDLRRPEMTQMLGFRHRVIRTIREYLDERGFVDVETPMLGRSTPEGARDFLVPARLLPGRVLRPAAVAAAAEAALDGRGPGPVLPDRPVLPG